MTNPVRIFVQASSLLLAVLLAIGLSPGAAAPADASPVDLKVMSFNIRYSRGGPQEPAAENDWNDPKSPRRERAIRVVREEAPDILGVQEARGLQIDDFREALAEYSFYGIGRDDGKTEGEFCGIFYLKDRFEQIDVGSFWLSATPEKPGTSFYNVPTAVPRIASWVVLRDKNLGREFFVLNMHWDHISQSARLKSAALARKRIAETAKEMPVIAMGDLNAPEDSRPVMEFSGLNDSAGRALVDTYRKLKPRRAKDESTFNHWRGTTDGSRIDFIFCTPDLEPADAAIVRTAYGGLYPSDHYPITATLKISAQKK